MELLLLISYFIDWMHYPNTATNCAFDMHRQEGGREGRKEAGREEKGEGEELFSARDCFNLPMPPCLKALQNQISVLASPVAGIPTSSNQISVSYISKIKIYHPVYSQDSIINTLFYFRKNYIVSIWVYILLEVEKIIKNPSTETVSNAVKMQNILSKSRTKLYRCKYLE